jgi:hypothetical protein
MAYTYDNIGNNGGQIFLDPDGSTLWSIRSESGSDSLAAPHSIKYSTDSGLSWTTWKVLDYPAEAYFPLMRDALGNFYYPGCETFSKTYPNPYIGNAGSSAYAKLYRVDASTKNTTVCFTFMAALTSAYPWGMTEDLDGYLYIGQYGNLAVGVPGAYIWKTSPGGNSWTRIDYWSGDKHIHNIKCNPYNGKLYITIGDDNKVCYVNSDKLATSTATKIGGSTGYTGLTFTSEAVYGGDDKGTNGGNRIWRSIADGAPTVIWSPPLHYDESIYGLTAYGDDELWFTSTYEGGDSTLRNAVWALTKPAGSGVSGTWTSTKVWDGPSTGAPVGPLSQNSKGIVPRGHNYVYFWSFEFGESTVRVQRAFISTFQVAPTQNGSTTVTGTKQSGLLASWVSGGTPGTITQTLAGTTWSLPISGLPTNSNTSVIVRAMNGATEMGRANVNVLYAVATSCTALVPSLGLNAALAAPVVTAYQRQVAACNVPSFNISLKLSSPVVSVPGAVSAVASAPSFALGVALTAPVVTASASSTSVVCSVPGLYLRFTLSPPTITADNQIRAPSGYCDIFGNPLDLRDIFGATYTLTGITQ